MNPSIIWNVYPYSCFAALFFGVRCECVSVGDGGVLGMGAYTWVESVDFSLTIENRFTFIKFIPVIINVIL